MSRIIDLIHAELESSPEADPAIIAEHVLKHLTEEDKANALSIAFPIYVRVIARAVVRDTHHRSRGAPATPVKAMAFIERKRLALSMDERRWKFLADCTYDDLMAAVDIRRKIAEATLTEAARLGELASQLQQHGALTVRELPAEVIIEALR